MAETQDIDKRARWRRHAIVLAVFAGILWFGLNSYVAFVQRKKLLTLESCVSEGMRAAKVDGRNHRERDLEIREQCARFSPSGQLQVQASSEQFIVLQDNQGGILAVWFIPENTSMGSMAEGLAYDWSFPKGRR